MEHWSSERWSNLPEDTQLVSPEPGFKLKYLWLIAVPSPVFGFLLYGEWCCHTLFSARTSLSLWGSLSSPKRAVISCISWLLAQEYCFWTCVIYPSICKAASCLGNKYFCKYGRKIGFAYPEVGRAPGILGKDVGANICMCRRGPGFAHQSHGREKDSWSLSAKVALVLINRKSALS